MHGRDELAPAVLGRDVISGEEDEEHVRARDVLLEQRDVREVVHVEEDREAGEHLAEALLKRGALVLPVLPAMAEEEMVAAVRGGRRQHHRLAWSGLGLGLGLGSGLGLASPTPITTALPASAW